MNREANCCSRLCLVDYHIRHKIAVPPIFLAPFWGQKMASLLVPLKHHKTTPWFRKRSCFGSAFESPESNPSSPKSGHPSPQIDLLCVRQPYIRCRFVGNVVIIGMICCWPEITNLSCFSIATNPLLSCMSINALELWIEVVTFVVRISPTRLETPEDRSLFWLGSRQSQKYKEIWTSFSLCPRSWWVKQHSMNCNLF